MNAQRFAPHEKRPGRFGAILVAICASTSPYQSREIKRTIYLRTMFSPRGKGWALLTNSVDVEDTEGQQEQGIYLIEEELDKMVFPVKSPLEVIRYKDEEHKSRKLFHVLVIVFGIVLVSAGVYLVVRPASTCNDEKCRKEEEIARDIRSAMDLGVDPCNDFYKYSCGNWEKTHSLNGENYTDALGQITFQNTKVIRYILESLQSFNGASKKVKDFYMSCINKPDIPPTTTTTPPSVFSGWNFTDYDYNDNDNVTVTEDDDYDWLKYRSLQEKYDKVRKSLEPFLTGADDAEFNSIICAKLTQKSFPDVTSRLFVENAYSPQKEAKLLLMLQQVSSTFQKYVAKLSWMDHFSKSGVIEKLKGTSFKLGAPPSIHNTAEEDARYQTVSISEEGSAFFRNLDSVDDHASYTISDSFLDIVMEGNAFYLIMKDELTVPAGIVQTPFFHEDYPDIVIFSKLGSTLAHEYTHAFEEYVNGHQSIWGISVKPSYVSQPSSENFATRTNCLKTEYDHFSLPNSTSHLSGENTWSENLADILGLQVAFTAFTDLYKKDYKPLRGLEIFSPEQLFFVSAAQMYCRAYVSEEARENILRDFTLWGTHSPNYIRVLGEIANNDEFAKAFACPAETKYNPSKKCRFFD